VIPAAHNHCIGLLPIERWPNLTMPDEGVDLALHPGSSSEIMLRRAGSSHHFAAPPRHQRGNDCQNQNAPEEEENFRSNSRLISAQGAVVDVSPPSASARPRSTFIVSLRRASPFTLARQAVILERG
jgi:hypothetical protein